VEALREPADRLLAMARETAGQEAPAGDAALSAISAAQAPAAGSAAAATLRDASPLMRAAAGARLAWAAQQQQAAAAHQFNLQFGFKAGPGPGGWPCGAARKGRRWGWPGWC
jgi:long-subunit fatty acid transport protein